MAFYLLLCSLFGTQNLFSNGWRCSKLYECLLVVWAALYYPIPIPLVLALIKIPVLVSVHLYFWCMHSCFTKGNTITITFAKSGNIDIAFLFLSWDLKQYSLTVILHSHICLLLFTIHSALEELHKYLCTVEGCIVKSCHNDQM